MPTPRRPTTRPLSAPGAPPAAVGPTTPKRETVRPIAAVQRALAVLDCLAASPTDLGTNEIARRVGSNASSVSRLLSTFASADYVRRLPHTGRYRLGLRLVELGHSALARVDLREVARPHLQALTAISGETATLSVPGEATPMTVDFVQSPASVRSVAQLGRPAVPHATATGKVFLAFRDLSRDLSRDVQRDDVHSENVHSDNVHSDNVHSDEVERPLARFTHRTIADPHRLAEELARVREHGWAQALGEREDELNAIAVPVLAAGGELVAMLGVQGPAGRFHATAIQGLLPPLREHAHQLAGQVAPQHG